MERVFWGIGGLGVCAALVYKLPTENQFSVILSCVAVLVIARFMMIVCDINEKMDILAAILLDEDEEEQIFHPPYDIELPEDED